MQLKTIFSTQTQKIYQKITIFRSLEQNRFNFTEFHNGISIAQKKLKFFLLSDFLCDFFEEIV